jgi:hypothetical protein
MLMDARPWANYWSDYRPMVQFCKHAQLPVVAANAPRRFVGAAGRRGPGALQEEWPSRAAGWLPPLPLPQPSAEYLTHLFHDAAFLSEASREQLGLSLNAVGGSPPGGPAVGAQASSGGGLPAEKEAGDAGGGRGGCPYIGLSRRDALLLPMLLWDASMACAIKRQLDRAPNQAVLHVCGSFHCEGKHGISEMIEFYRPGTRQLVVVVYPEADPRTFLDRHRGAADFVILTNAAAATEDGERATPVKGPHEFSQEQREAARIARFKA